MRLSLAGERQAAGVFVERITELEVCGRINPPFYCRCQRSRNAGLQRQACS